MDWPVFVLEVAKVLLTWPVAAVAIAFILRGSLVKLIDRIVSVRVFNWTYGNELNYQRRSRFRQPPHPYCPLACCSSRRNSKK